MSSTSTNPYKSRLLNLINRQSLRLKEQLNRTGRHLKLAVETGVQILVYPLYLLVQTGRMAQRQLQQKLEKPQFLLSPSSSNSELVSCDRSINHILESVEPWLNKDYKSIAPAAVSPALEQVSMSSLVPQNNNLKIQGIATFLPTRKLVLVTSENLLIDIFSSAQQEQLLQRIDWEIIDYQYQQKLQLQATKKFPSLIPSFQVNNPNVLPPIRWFWTVMRWIQTSQVATAINLFGESTLIHHAPTSTQIIPFEDKSHSLTLEEKNNLLTSVESLDNYSVNLGRIQVLIQAAVEHFFGQEKVDKLKGYNFHSLISSTDNQLSNLTQKITTFVNTVSQPKLFSSRTELTVKKKTEKSSTISTTEPDPFQIQVLIQAAIDYFFGQQQKNVLLQEAKLTHSSNQLEPDPWLSWDDLYSHNISQESKPNTILTQPAKLPVSETKIQKNKPKSLDIKSPKNLQIHQSQKTSQSVDVAEQSLITVTSIAPQNNQLESIPEWIEAEVTPIGYVKHPLVKTLEGLDRLIFQLEKFGLQLWNWFKSVINKKEKS